MPAHDDLQITADVFLRRVWPATGVYALATPFTIPGTTTRTYAHRTFDTIDEAVQYIEKEKSKTDIYFAVHTLRAHKVWNAEKIDRKTGEKGAYEVRTHANMAASRTLFFDIDVGTDAEGDRKYATQHEALTALRTFCQETQLPKPIVVSSGGGLHVYWTFDTPLPSEQWLQVATELRDVARHHRLRVDPSRTTDRASVLRVAGTFNRKSTPYRLVTALAWGHDSEQANLVQRIHDAYIRTGATTPRPSAIELLSSQPSDTAAILGSNLGDLPSGPPVAMRALIAACPQMQRMARLRGNVSEPEWYHTLNLVRFVENGDALAHKISEGHPQYDYDATVSKLQQLEHKQIKPTTCAKLAEVAGAERCTTCAFYGQVKSPLVAARYLEAPPAIVIAPPPGVTTPDVVIPEPPYPYMRLKGGGITMKGKTPDGEDTHTTIYPYDLYPVRRLVNEASAIEQHVWCVVLPREGSRQFLMDADALYDRRKFVVAIANHGVYPPANFVPMLQDYMIAYISELQRTADADAQCNHLGWSAEYSQFIFPDKILHADGQVRAAQLSAGASRSSVQVHTRGDLATQVELLTFYQHAAYRPNQFLVLASLAAPIFFATGHHGVIVNASGEAGASKSTSLYAAASCWGHPELYPINGTNTGATVRGRNERVTTLANLPICVDEITHLPPRDVIDLVMGVTQPGHRIRLNTDGVERSANGGHKATMMLTTANNSLHNILSIDNTAGTAGSMRVVEIQFHPHQVHAKHEADDFLHQLKLHYGHIGEAFVQHVVQHVPTVVARVQEMTRLIDQEIRTKSSERFWSSTIAAVLVAGEIAAQLGLITFDLVALRQWVVNVQVPYMRGVVVEEYTSPIGVLAEYLEQINGDILIAAKASTNANITNIIRSPRGQLLAHYDTTDKTMWVLKKSFKDYCVRTGSNALKVLDDLSVPRVLASGRPSRVIASKHTRKVLGAGTEYAKAQSWCFAINMADPEVTGAVDLELSVSQPVGVTPLRKKA